MHTVFGRGEIVPKLILLAGWIGRGRADLSHGRTALRPGLRLQDLPNLVRLALRNNQLQSIAESDAPALAAQNAKLTNVIDVHDRVAVDALKLRLCQPIFKSAK